MINSPGSEFRQNSRSTGLRIFSESHERDPLIAKLVKLAGLQARVQRNLNEYVMDVLDAPPAVAFFDVLAVTDLLITHLNRIRRDEGGQNTAIVVRSAALSEGDILGLLSCQINHLALAFSPHEALLEEIQCLLRDKFPAVRVSPGVVSLQERIQSRLPLLNSQETPEIFVDKLAKHFRFAVRLNRPGQARETFTWGFVPVSDAQLFIYTVFVQGPELGARKNALRVNGLVKSHGFSALVPDDAYRFIARHLSPFLGPTHRVRMFCGTYDSSSPSLAYASSFEHVTTQTGVLAPNCASVAAYGEGAIGCNQVPVPQNFALKIPFTRQTNLNRAVAPSANLKVSGDIDAICADLPITRSWLCLLLNAQKRLTHLTAADFHA